MTETLCMLYSIVYGWRSIVHMGTSFKFLSFYYQYLIFIYY